MTLQFSGDIIENFDEANSQFILLIKKPQTWALYKKLGTRYFRFHPSEFVFWDDLRKLSAVVNCSSLIFFPIYVREKCCHSEPGPPGYPGVPGQDGPPGAPGAEGSPGVPGQPGTPGTNGSTGFPGANGLTGNSGVNGSNGTPGLPGNSGLAGFPGFPGSNGSDGIPGITLNGVPGTPGIPGADGTDGSDGINGTPGLDGTNGSPGIDGTPGSSGIDGPNGSNGTDGSAGADGTPGSSGSNGSPGAPGPKGLPGNSGHMGSIGSPGSQGFPGLPGRNGTDGTNGSPGNQGDPGSPGSPGGEGSPGESGSNGLTGNPGAPGVEGVPGENGANNGQVGDPGPPGYPGNPGAPGVNGNPGLGLVSYNFNITNSAASSQTLAPADSGTDSYITFSSTNNNLILLPVEGDYEVSYNAIVAPVDSNYVSLGIIFNGEPVESTFSFAYTQPGVPVQITGTGIITVPPTITASHNEPPHLKPKAVLSTLNSYSVFNRGSNKLLLPASRLTSATFSLSNPTWIIANNFNTATDTNSISVTVDGGNSGTSYCCIQIQSLYPIINVTVSATSTKNSSTTYSLIECTSSTILLQYPNVELYSGIFYSDDIFPIFDSGEGTLTFTAVANTRDGTVSRIAIEAVNIGTPYAGGTFNQAGSNPTGFIQNNQTISSYNSANAAGNFVELMSVALFQVDATIPESTVTIDGIDGSYDIDFAPIPDLVDNFFLLGCDLTQSQSQVIAVQIENVTGIVYYNINSVCINLATPAVVPINTGTSYNNPPTGKKPIEMKS